MFGIRSLALLVFICLLIPVWSLPLEQEEANSVLSPVKRRHELKSNMKGMTLAPCKIKGFEEYLNNLRIRNIEAYFKLMFAANMADYYIIKDFYPWALKQPHYFGNLHDLKVMAKLKEDFPNYICSKRTSFGEVVGKCDWVILKDMHKYNIVSVEAVNHPFKKEIETSKVFLLNITKPYHLESKYKIFIPATTKHPATIIPLTFIFEKRENGDYMFFVPDGSKDHSIRKYYRVNWLSDDYVIEFRSGANFYDLQLQCIDKKENIYSFRANGQTALSYDAPMLFYKHSVPSLLNYWPWAKLSQIFGKSKEIENIQSLAFKVIGAPKAIRS